MTRRQKTGLAIMVSPIAIALLIGSICSTAVLAVAVVLVIIVTILTGVTMLVSD